MSKMILLATVHNLEMNDKDLKIVLDKLSNLFSNVFISVSTTTFNDVKNIFVKDEKINCIVIPPNGAADARRQVLRNALSVGLPGQYFYCDFDKLIVAILEKEQSFCDLINSIAIDGYMIVGRDKEGFLSYPKTWQDTERITNNVGSFLFELNDIDITAGCCAFDSSSAKTIDKYSV